MKQLKLAVQVKIILKYVTFLCCSKICKHELFTSVNNFFVFEYLRILEIGELF